MATRAVVVVVERSPGGGHGWYTELSGERVWRPGTLSRVALGWVRRHMVSLGATEEECRRVDRLILAELAHKRRAEVTAEVPIALTAQERGALVFAKAVDLLVSGGAR